MTIPGYGGPHHPLVILVGWLGCRPRSLFRYAKLYTSLGISAHMRIPTPVMLVNTVLSNPNQQQQQLRIPRAWPHDHQESSQTTLMNDTTNTNHPDNNNTNVTTTTTTTAISMEELAWNILADLDSSDNPMIFFHVFSNGGCFLWEKIHAILNLAKPLSSSSKTMSSVMVPLPIQHRLAALRERIVGVVFDSCPGADPTRLSKALSYCSWTEMAQVMLFTPYIQFHLPHVQQQATDRSHQYIQFLAQDDWDIPQLYLYSENDTLAPFQALEKLIAKRIELHGPGKIWKRKWTESAHCAHLYHHPDDYKLTVTSFVDACIMRALKEHQRSLL